MAICNERIRPIQWLTATIGLFQSCDTVLATIAMETKGAPIPGPGKTISCLNLREYCKITGVEYTETFQFTITDF